MTDDDHRRSTNLIGAGVGAALFAATDNPVWLGVGAGIGAAIGAGATRRSDE
ncbi:MAG: hypothetical protein OEQ47_09835 [Acidimicrobiia bacterium]|nr:hypothetical protein [Acidimicrobiia bacterium]